MKIVGIIRRPAPQPLRVAAGRRAFAPQGRHPLRRTVPVRATLSNHSIFETARRASAAQVMSADGVEQLTRASTLHAALRKYMALEQAWQTQQTSSDKVRRALAEVLKAAHDHQTREAEHGNVAGSAAKPHIWRALVLAGRLRDVELESDKADRLPPRMTAPYVTPPTWQALVAWLEKVEHDAWPPEVRAWSQALLPAMLAYVAQEEAVACLPPTPLTVERHRALVADVLAKIVPPTPDTIAHEVRQSLREKWRIESARKGFGDMHAMCKTWLVLRQVELADLAALLA